MIHTAAYMQGYYINTFLKTGPTTVAASRSAAMRRVCVHVESLRSG